MLDQKKDNIVKTLEEIAELCKAHETNDWAKCFHYFAEQVKDYEWNSAKRKIMTVYAGMASFSDLVLHKNGKVLWIENQVLDNLRDRLYKQVADNW